MKLAQGRHASSGQCLHCTVQKEIIFVFLKTSQAETEFKKADIWKKSFKTKIMNKNYLYLPLQSGTIKYLVPLMPENQKIIFKEPLAIGSVRKQKLE